MSIITVPYVFSAGSTIIAAQHNSNFSTIYNDYNGNISNVNISASAGIVYSKLNLGGNIVNSDISGSAAIVGSKIVSISGSQLTALSGINSSAGFVPLTNLASGTATSGLVILSNGTGSPPSWGQGGALQLISNTVVSSAATTGNISITNTNFYKILFAFNNFSASDYLQLQFNADSGNDYSWIYNGRTGAGAIGTTGNPSSSIVFMTANYNGSNTYATNGEFIIFPQSTLSGKAVNIFGAMSYLNSAGLPAMTNFGGNWANSGAAATSFLISSNGGATFSGNVYLYNYTL